MTMGWLNGSREYSKGSFGFALARKSLRRGKVELEPSTTGLMNTEGGVGWRALKTAWSFSSVGVFFPL